MNNMKRLITAGILLGLAAQPSCHAATKNYTLFEVVHVWEQGSNFYILYDKKSSLYQYSMKNIDGTLIKEKVERGYKKVASARIKNRVELDLRTGQLMKDLIYIDDDFVMYEEKPNFIVKTKGQTIRASCGGSLWAGTNAVRLTKEVFYCGKFFPAVGLGQRTLPEAAMSALETSAAVRDRGNVEATLAISSIASAGENIVIFPSNEGTDTGKLDSLIIDTGNFKVRSESHPFDKNLYRWTNYQEAYFPDGRLLSKRDAGSSPYGMTACNPAGCKFVPFPDAFAYMYISRVNATPLFLSTKQFGLPKVRVKM